MNTPAYFCIDQVKTSDETISTKNLALASLEVFPNPTSEYVSINWTEQETAQVQLISLAGQIVHTQNLNLGTNEMRVKGLPKGSYILNIVDRLGWKSELLIVH